MEEINALMEQRKAKLEDMDVGESRVRLVYSIPTRGLIGFHSAFLTETKGMGIANSSLIGTCLIGLEVVPGLA